MIALVLAHLDERDRFLRCASVSKVWRQTALKLDIPLLDLTPNALFGHEFMRRCGKYKHTNGEANRYAEIYRRQQQAVGLFFKECPFKVFLLLFYFILSYFILS